MANINVNIIAFHMKLVFVFNLMSLSCHLFMPFSANATFL